MSPSDTLSSHHFKHGGGYRDQELGYVVVGEEAAPEDFQQAAQRFTAFLYTGDGIIASPRPYRFQVILDVLTVIFDRIGLNTNANKMVGMVYQPCHMSGKHLEAAYEIHIMGVGV